MKTLMKLLLLLLICSNATGQTYYHFPLSNTIWNIYEHNVWSNSNTEMKRYAFFNDTVTINNKVYSKLYEIDDTTINCSSANYLFPFREDSSKKVYFKIDTTEVLLYDFSLNVGDTIHYNYLFYGNFINPSNHFKRLDSIGSIQINNLFRKIYYFSGGITGNTWIEGIGAIDGEGLFAPIADICTCGLTYELACVKQNDTAIWINNPICNRCFCNLYLNIENIQTNIEITVYPNPTENSFKIDLAEMHNCTMLKLFSSDMKLINQFNIENEKQIIINQNIKSGLYFIEISNGSNNKITRKIIIK
ncbi:MAG: T9SS type A sorting domain-containing protein [Bacteroidia bacterium]|nr:T9SS type A sorting domain-containing protein [Bacteroidia bacterium]